jgi:CheY-like chemotaxis protein
MRDTQLLTVGVVDDDALTRDLICSMLQARAYQAIPFASAGALALARQSQVLHVLILDLSMPDVDGFELIYQLAAQQPVVPVIISSSQSNDIRQAARMVCESLNITVLGILPKPFASDELGLLLAPLAQSLAFSSGSAAAGEPLQGT